MFHLLTCVGNNADPSLGQVHFRLKRPTEPNVLAAFHVIVGSKTTTHPVMFLLPVWKAETNAEEVIKLLIPPDTPSVTPSDSCWDILEHVGRMFNRRRSICGRAIGLFAGCQEILVVCRRLSSPSGTTIC